MGMATFTVIAEGMEHRAEPQEMTVEVVKDAMEQYTKALRNEDAWMTIITSPDTKVIIPAHRILGIHVDFAPDEGEQRIGEV